MIPRAAFVLAMVSAIARPPALRPAKPIPLDTCPASVPDGAR